MVCDAILVFLIYIFGTVFGLVAYGVTYNVAALLLKVTMNLEMMSGSDEIFFQDDHRNCTNIVAYHKYEKFDHKKMAY